MIEFIQHCINGLSLGSIYALIALGYTMVFGILKLINFAHGDVYMLGAFVGYYAARFLNFGNQSSFFSLLVTLMISMIACAGAGFLIERLAYRPLRKAGPGTSQGHNPGHSKTNALITAIGVSLFLEYSGQLLFGSDPKFFPQLYRPDFQFPDVLSTWGNWTDSSGNGLRVNPLQLLVLGISLVLMTLIQLIVYKTRIGRAMRATSFNHDLASLMGIPTNKMISYTFMMGSAMAGAAGVLVGMIYPKIEPMMGTLPGLKAFVAAVLGGVGNVIGAVVGSIFLGMAEEFLVGYWAPTYRDALAFGLLILVLLFKPAGLFGSNQAEKV